MKYVRHVVTGHGHSYNISPQILNQAGGSDCGEEGGNEHRSLPSHVDDKEAFRSNFDPPRRQKQLARLPARSQKVGQQAQAVTYKSGPNLEIVVIGRILCSAGSVTIFDLMPSISFLVVHPY